MGYLRGRTFFQSIIFSIHSSCWISRGLKVEHWQVQRCVGKRLQMRLEHHTKCFVFCGPKKSRQFLQVAMFWFLMTSSDGQIDIWSAFRLQNWVEMYEFSCKLVTRLMLVLWLLLTFLVFLQMFCKDVQVEIHPLNYHHMEYKKMVSAIGKQNVLQDVRCKNKTTARKAQHPGSQKTSFCGALGNQTHFWNEISECTVELTAVEFEISGGSPFFH